MATREFQNAMLKTLEEPPKDNHFILCTTEINRVAKTIQTRAVKLQVELLSVKKVTRLIQMVCKHEQIKLSDEVMNAVVGAADGSPRQALTVLQAVAGIDSEKEQIRVANNYAETSEKTLADLAQALLYHKPWSDVATILTELDRNEAETVRNQLLSYFEKVLLSKGAKATNVAGMMDFFLNNLYSSGRPGLTQACLFAWLSQEKGK